MGDETKIVITGDSAGADKALAGLERKFLALENQLKQMRRRTKENEDGFLGMSRQVSQVAEALTGIGSPLDAILQGVQLIKAEWTDILARQEKARASAMTYAQALEGAAVNLAGDEAFPDVAAVDARVKQISRKTGTSPDVVARALNDAMAAGGSLSGDQKAKAVEAVMELIPNAQQAHSDVVSAALSIQKNMPGSTAEQSIGFLMQAMQSSRVSDVQGYSRNVIPALTSSLMQDPSGDIRGNAAIVNTLGQLADDPEGRRTRTAAIALNMQLKEFLGDMPQLDSNMKRIEFMQQNPEAVQAFMYGGEFGGKKRKMRETTVTTEMGETIQLGGDKASFETQMKPAIEKLLSGGAGAEAFAKTFARMPEFAGAAAFFDQMNAGLDANPNLANADISRRGMNQAELARLDDFRGQRLGAVRQSMQEQMEAAGVPSFSRYGAGAAFDMATGSDGGFGQSVAGGMLVGPLGSTAAAAAQQTGIMRRMLDIAMQQLEVMRRPSLNPAAQAEGGR